VKRLVLPRAAADAAAAAGRAGYPFEICGALIGQRDKDHARVARVVPFPNVAEESQRRRRFAVDPVELIRLDRELRKSGEKLLGFYHSHPDHPAAPSPTDMEYFRLWPQTVWLIIPIANQVPGRSRAWWLESHDSESAAEIEVREEG
jgi:proteasome lid subunit RPN8/RPN11